MFSQLRRALFAGILSLACAVPFIPNTASAQATQQAPALQTIKSKGELRVGWATFYPYVYRDSKTKEITGFAADFMKIMADGLGVKLVWVEDSWATLVAGLQTNKYDMTIPGVAVTLQRAEVVTFSKPIVKMPLGLLVMKKEGRKLKSWEELDKPGVKITTTLGSVVDLFATKRFKKAEILRVKAGPDSIAQVVAGKADAWANGLEGLHMVAKDRNDMEVVPGEFGANPICLIVRQGDFVTRDYVNLFIDDLRRSGVLKTLSEKHGLYEWEE
jgi:cyclohexadienyl dehydratase